MWTPQQRRDKDLRERFLSSITQPRPRAAARTSCPRSRTAPPSGREPAVREGGGVTRFFRGRARAATARGGTAALREGDGGSRGRGRGSVAMATAAEGLPEAGAQPAKRKGPGVRGRVCSLAARPLAGCQAAASARPREGQAGWAGGWLRAGMSVRPSVCWLEARLRSSSGPLETESLSLQAGGKADAAVSCAGSA